jgi:hypothetical protein
VVALRRSGCCQDCCQPTPLSPRQTCRCARSLPRPLIARWRPSHAAASGTRGAGEGPRLGGTRGARQAPPRRPRARGSCRSLGVGAVPCSGGRRAAPRSRRRSAVGCAGGGVRLPQRFARLPTGARSPSRGALASDAPGRRIPVDRACLPGDGHPRALDSQRRRPVRPQPVLRRPVVRRIPAQGTTGQGTTGRPERQRGHVAGQDLDQIDRTLSLREPRRVRRDVHQRRPQPRTAIALARQG